MTQVKLLQAATVVAACLTFGGAQAALNPGEVQTAGFANGSQSVSFQWNYSGSGSHAGSTGGFNVNWGGDGYAAADSFIGVCIDLNQTIGVSGLYSGYTAVSAVSYLGQPKVNLLSQLYQNYYSSMLTSGGGANAAAFQVGVWEILVDGNTSNFANFTNGDFKVTSALTSQMNTLQTALNTFDTGTNFANWNFAVLTNKDHQDILVAIDPVPEPGTWALMLAGLGLMGFVSRRRLS